MIVISNPIINPFLAIGKFLFLNAKNIAIPPIHDMKIGKRYHILLGLSSNGLLSDKAILLKIYELKRIGV